MIEGNELLDILDEVHPDADRPEQHGDGEVREPWVAKDEADADWCIQKIAGFNVERDRLTNLAAAEKMAWDTWLKARSEMLDQEIAHFEGYLREYHLTRLEADPDLKTVSLPHGSSSFRKQQPEFKRDEPTIVDWAKESKYVQWLKGLDWSALKDAGTVKDGGLFTPDGERVPSVEVQERPDLTHSVKVK